MNGEELTESQRNNRRKRARVKALKANDNSRAALLEETLRKTWLWLATESDNPEALRQILLRADADHALRMALTQLDTPYPSVRTNP